MQLHIVYLHQIRRINVDQVPIITRFVHWISIRIFFMMNHTRFGELISIWTIYQRGINGYNEFALIILNCYVVDNKPHDTNVN